MLVAQSLRQGSENEDTVYLGVVVDAVKCLIEFLLGYFLIKNGYFNFNACSLESL